MSTQVREQPDPWLRQHAADPSRTAGRTGFERSDVVNLNADLAQLLRSIIRGGGPLRDRPSTSTRRPSSSEDGPLRISASGKQREETFIDVDDYARATLLADEAEENAAAADAALNRGPCPTLIVRPFGLVPRTPLQPPSQENRCRDRTGSRCLPRVHPQQ